MTLARPEFVSDDLNVEGPIKEDHEHALFFIRRRVEHHLARREVAVPAETNHAVVYCETTFEYDDGVSGR
jgi:hypothetical protein